MSLDKLTDVEAWNQYNMIPDDFEHKSVVKDLIKKKFGSSDISFETLTELGKKYHKNTKVKKIYTDE